MSRSNWVIRPREVIRVGPVDDGDDADAEAGHPVGDRAEDLVRVGDGRREIMASRTCCPPVADASTADQGSDPDEVAVGVEDRIEPLAALGRSFAERPVEIRDPVVSARR